MYIVYVRVELLFRQNSIGCSTPSNVLPFYVTAETGAAECPGFAALSTLFLKNSALISKFRPDKLKNTNEMISRNLL